MDRRYFIHPRSIVGTSVEGKVIALLNSLNTAEDFDIIQDRPGFGYAVTQDSIANALEDAFSDQIDNSDDPLLASIDYMASHATVQTVTVDEDEMALDIWLTLPFTI